MIFSLGIWKRFSDEPLVIGSLLATHKIQNVDECEHGLRLDRCAYCKQPPVGINKTVYVTDGGFAFHNSKDCEGLRSGQEKAESAEMETHPIVSVPWGHVAALRTRCQYCCPKS